jgi:hypothetical protein
MILTTAFFGTISERLIHLPVWIEMSILGAFISGMVPVSRRKKIKIGN